MSTEQLLAVIDNVPAYIYQFDLTDRYVFVNRAYERLVGRARARVIGRHVTDLFAPEVAAAFLEHNRRVRMEGVTLTFEERAPWPDGEHVYTSIKTPMFDATGSLRGVLGISTDITEQKRAEEAVHTAATRLRAERDRAELYFASAGAMLLVLGTDGRVQRINRRGLRIIGYEREDEVIGRDWFEHFVPRDARERLHAALRDYLERGARARAYESEVLARDGSVRLISWRNTVLRDEQGRIVATVSSGEDVTERRRAEERRELLMHELNHRVKNSLAVVQSLASQTLRSTTSVAEFGERFSGRLATLAAAHEALVQRAWEAVDLASLLERTRASVGSPERFTFSGDAVQLAPNAAVSLSMLFHELTTNAVKHGALSRPEGLVDLYWRVAAGPDAPALELRWSERSARRVEEPAGRGFGTRLIEQVVRELDARAAWDWTRHGLTLSIAIPLGSQVSIAPGSDMERNQ